MKTHAPPFRFLNLIFHLKLCCFAALLTLPIALQLMATSGKEPPVVIVDPPPSYFQNPIQTEPIKNDLIITNKTYNYTTATVTEGAVYTVQTQGRVLVPSGADVCFETSKRITLKSGFRAAQGSRFQARIGFSVETLNRPSEATGIPLGLFWVSNTNNNGVPDLVLISLNLDPKANHSGNTQVQNFLQTTSSYGYDNNSQLISAPERKFKLDEEGNITGQQ